ncbi:hypothetical protein [Cohnella sp. 56]|uniref:hypothetical protein n=1 Tax=Cohnella sp. 56 TaxID=3113722 RepID=UPI0030E9BEC5
MSDRSIEWENQVKQGLFADEIFSDEMKLSVLKAVERRPAYWSRQWMRLAGVVVLGIVAVMVAVNWPYGNADKAVFVSSAEARLPVAFEPLAAREMKWGQVIAQADPDILPGLSNKYNPLTNETNGYIPQIQLNDIQLLDERPIAGFGVALHYTLKPDSTAPNEIRGNPDFFGFKVNGQAQPEMLYHYGTGHMYGLQFSMTRLFGQPVLKIEQTVCRTDGEACVWYLKKNSEGQVFTYMQLDAASYERDLDGDGKEEAIIVTRKQNQIYIFKEQDGQLLWASAREALKVSRDDSIQYDHVKGSFRIHSLAGGEDAYTFQGGPDSFVRSDSNDM